MNNYNFLLSLLLSFLLLLNSGEGRVSDHHHEEDKSTGHHDKGHDHHKWDYTKEGQLKWQHAHQDCGGEVQSPIKISTKRAMAANFSALEMVGYHNPLPLPLTITNNGHSVSLSPGPSSNEIEDMPYIFGGPLRDNEFELVSLHFHWGRRNNRGSEHIINSIRYAMEMHIIHRNRRYDTVEEALKHSDGLAVVAFFFQAGERGNARLDHLLRVLPMVRKSGDRLELDTSIALAWLQPRDIDTFYSYQGSLTTPPCSEAVSWLLFPHALHVSFEQMDMFRQIYSGSDEPLVDNFRHPQPIGTRPVYVHRLKMNNNHNGYNGNNNNNGQTNFGNKKK